MRRDYNGWIVVSEGPTGVYMLIGGNDADEEDLPTAGIGTGSVAIQNGTGKKYLYHESDGWLEIP